MQGEYWGNDIDPDEDDFDRWCDPDDENDGELEEDPSIDEQFAILNEVLDEIGPAAVLETVSAYLYELERPYHRSAYQAHKLSDRILRAAGAVEEAYQTRDIRQG